MNRVVLMGRLTRDPVIRYTQGQDQKCVARYTLAVDRRKAVSQEQQADFISCVAFGKAGEFIEKYVKKGTKLVISGRIQTGSYTNREGQKIYTMDVVADEQEFAESKRTQENAGSSPEAEREEESQDKDGFMHIPEGMQEELPFA